MKSAPHLNLPEYIAAENKGEEKLVLFEQRAANITVQIVREVVT